MHDARICIEMWDAWPAKHAIQTVLTFALIDYCHYHDYYHRYCFCTKVNLSSLFSPFLFWRKFYYIRSLQQALMDDCYCTAYFGTMHGTNVRPYEITIFFICTTCRV